MQELFPPYPRARPQTERGGCEFLVRVRQNLYNSLGSAAANGVLPPGFLPPPLLK
jgi:hypothetical protein